MATCRHVLCQAINIILRPLAVFALAHTCLRDCFRSCIRENGTCRHHPEHTEAILDCNESGAARIYTRQLAADAPDLNAASDLSRSTGLFRRRLSVAAVLAIHPPRGDSREVDRWLPVRTRFWTAGSPFLRKVGTPGSMVPANTSVGGPSPRLPVNAPRNAPGVHRCRRCLPPCR